MSAHESIPQPTARPLGPAVLPAMSPLPVVAIPPGSKPRFCRSCGTAWQADWVDCLPCAARSGAAAPALSVAIELRAMKSALWLYFSLLLVCAVGLGLSIKLGGVVLEMWVTAALSITTIAWCCGSPQSVLPLLRRVAPPKWFGIALGLSLVTYSIAVGVIHGLNSLMHLPDESASRPFLVAGYSWAVIVLVSCIQPAVIEELAFRGVIFAGLTKALSSSETILVSAMMFMILHLSPMRFPHTLALGIGAGYLRFRTRSIYPCMLMHFSHNLLCVGGEWLKHS